MEVQEVIVIDGVALADLGELFWQVPGDQQLHLERSADLTTMRLHAGQAKL